MRAYIREIDQKGLLEEVAIDPKRPPTKVGGINPERWLESVQNDSNNGIAPALSAMSIGSDGSSAKELSPTETNSKFLPSMKISKPNNDLPSRYLSPIEEQPRRNSDGTRPRAMQQSETPSGRDVAIYDSDSSSDEDSRRSLVQSKPSSTSLIIRTSDLIATAPSSAVPESGRKRGDPLAPKSAEVQVEYGSSPNWRDTIPAPDSSKSRISGEEKRLAPDEYGNEIPADAKWTKVTRRLISPEVLEQDRRRYEA